MYKDVCEFLKLLSHTDFYRYYSVFRYRRDLCKSSLNLLQCFEEVCGNTLYDDYDISLDICSG